MWNFVREKSEAINVPRVPNETNGEAIKMTYESIVNTPSTSASTMREVKPPKNPKLARKKRIPFDEKRFFSGALKDDVASLELMILSPENINRCDPFGWTALMMAACEGSLNAVKLLLRKNADTSIADGRGRTALSLAQSRNHLKIVELLTEDVTVISSSDDEDETVEAKVEKPHSYCETCQINIIEPNESKHLASTLHLFNAQNTHKFARHFGIPDSNVGFRMMLRQGWNRETGLGPEQDGQLYPVKTRLRKPRSGLGTQQPRTAKITHFQPFDTDAVRSLRPPQPPETTGRQLKRQKARERRKERHLRNQLS